MTTGDINVEQLLVYIDDMLENSVRTINASGHISPLRPDLFGRKYAVVDVAPRLKTRMATTVSGSLV